MDIMEKDQNCSDATKSWSSIEVLFCASSYLNSIQRSKHIYFGCFYELKFQHYFAILVYRKTVK